MEFPDQLKNAYDVYDSFQGRLAVWFSAYSSRMTKHHDVLLLWMTRKVFGDDLNVGKITYTGQTCRKTHDDDFEHLIQKSIDGYVFESGKDNGHKCYKITKTKLITSRGFKRAPVYELDVVKIDKNDVMAEKYGEYHANTFRHQMCKKLTSMSNYGFVPDSFDAYSMYFGIVRAKTLF